MNTKKALGALLGLLGSLPAALAFLPLAAGFSAPLLFTANLQRTNGSKKMESSARHRNRSGSRVNPPHLASALAAPLDLAPFMMADCCVNSNGDGQIRERRFEEGEGEFGEAHLERTARGKGRQDALRGEWGIRRPPFSAIPSDLHPTPNLNFQADPPHDMWGRQRPGPVSSYSDRLGGLGAAHVQVVEGLFAIPRKRGGAGFWKKIDILPVGPSSRWPTGQRRARSTSPIRETRPGWPVGAVCFLPVSNRCFQASLLPHHDLA
jgi:hypothetical protein